MVSDLEEKLDEIESHLVDIAQAIQDLNFNVTDNSAKASSLVFIEIRLGVVIGLLIVLVRR